MSDSVTVVYASADDLLSTSGKRRFTECRLPTCGKVVRVRSLTTSELEQYNSAVLTEDGSKIRKDRLSNATRRLIVLCAVDSEGNRLFVEKDIPRLASMDGLDAGVLYDCCAKHAGVNKSDIEALLKNSVETAAEGNS